jgi:hypothetical protein
MLVACNTLAVVGAVGVYTRLTACSIDTAFINVIALSIHLGKSSRTQTLSSTRKVNALELITTTTIVVITFTAFFRLVRSITTVSVPIAHQILRQTLVVTATPEITLSAVEFITAVRTVLVSVAHQVMSQTRVSGPAKESSTLREGSASTVGVRLIRAISTVLCSVTDPRQWVTFS